MTPAIYQNLIPRSNPNNETATAPSTRLVNGVSDIGLNAPFVAAQIASIMANRLGHGYVEIIINILLLLAAKGIFVAVQKIVDKANRQKPLS